MYCTRIYTAKLASKLATNVGKLHLHRYVEFNGRLIPEIKYIEVSTHPQVFDEICT